MLVSEDLISLVNPLQGTKSHYGFSTGNCLPLTAMPFGMNHWSAQTQEGSWYFNSGDLKLQGIRCTHQPSPWIGDYGAFVIMPQVGAPMFSAFNRSGAYRVDKTTFRPDRFSANVIRYNTQFEMAPTERGAIFQFHFPTSHESRIIVDPQKGESYAELTSDGRLIGWTRGNNGGTLEGFAHYFVATFSTPPKGCQLFTQNGAVPGTSHTAERAGISLEFDTQAGTPISMKIATSFISLEQAQRNLDRELAEHDFQAIADKAQAAWQEALGRIEVEGDPTDRRTFYTCLYRTQLFPRIFHEFDAEGKPAHYSPYSGKVHEGLLYTDNGFWDTYRTMYPLLALIAPERLNEILQGWVNAYKEGGWFPQWASPGYRACMVGTHIDAVFADAVARGVTNFDVETALEGMLKHAQEPGDADGAFGRIGIEDYRRLGYVPADKHHEAVARSLDYAYDDFCIAQVAQFLGKDEVAKTYLDQAKTYANLYDSNVGFMRGKNADGTWLEPWSEFQWGSPYVEGGPWQASWAAQHDPAGLMALMGGEDAFLAKLDQMLSTEPLFNVGVYGMEIHEMTEMAAADFGQYAHSNQPVHHVLYFYNSTGRPWRTQAEVRRVMKNLYSPEVQPGDEDNGEMSAWFVLSALGIFPLTPGKPTFTFGSPLFHKATVRLPHQHTLVIEAPGQADSAVFVYGISRNGSLIDSLEISHEDLSSGGTLTFLMSEHHHETVVPKDKRPSSLTPYS
jgi:predicted alpha-1,2-mannosidase